MVRTLFRTFCFLFIFCFPLHASSPAKEPPDVLLKRLTQEMITALREQDAQLKENPSLIFKIVDEILVPYIDWAAMAKWVIGRNAWLKASEAEQNRFVVAFQGLLIRTYAATLRAYNNQTIEYFPLRGEIKDRVQVMSLIKEPGRDPIRVTYRLADKGEVWKVYDISIEGVSLLKGFQSQFAADLQQGGLGELIKRLQDHNERPLR